MSLTQCSECLGLLSSKARSCPHCGDVKKSPVSPGFKRLLVYASVVLSLFLIGAVLDYSFFLNRIAFRIAISKYVPAHLKTPRTAQFCNYTDVEIVTEGYSFTVYGWVDAQNLFGAVIRNNFECMLVYDRFNHRWSEVRTDIYPAVH